MRSENENFKTTRKKFYVKLEREIVFLRVTDKEYSA